MSIAKLGIYEVRQQLYDATPMKVWKEYTENGYLWSQMVDEELSYAETEDAQ